MAPKGQSELARYYPAQTAFRPRPLGKDPSTSSGPSVLDQLQGRGAQRLCSGASVAIVAESVAIAGRGSASSPGTC